MKASVNNLRLAVAWIIVAAWVASLVLDGVVPDYEVPATVHGLMLIVAGYLFGPTIAGRGERKDEEEKHG